jgi:hypothetical protein
MGSRMVRTGNLEVITESPPKAIHRRLRLVASVLTPRHQQGGRAIRRRKLTEARPREMHIFKAPGVAARWSGCGDAMKMAPLHPAVSQAAAQCSGRSRHTQRL